MPKRGRPPILDDPFMQTSVLAMIAAGASRAAAARFVGVHVQTLRRRIRTDSLFAQRFLEAKAHYHGSTLHNQPHAAATRAAAAKSANSIQPQGPRLPKARLGCASGRNTGLRQRDKGPAHHGHESGRALGPCAFRGKLTADS